MGDPAAPGGDPWPADWPVQQTRPLPEDKGLPLSLTGADVQAPQRRSTAPQALLLLPGVLSLASSKSNSLGSIQGLGRGPSNATAATKDDGTTPHRDGVVQLCLGSNPKKKLVLQGRAVPTTNRFLVLSVAKSKKVTVKGIFNKVHVFGNVQTSSGDQPAIPPSVRQEKSTTTTTTSNPLEEDLCSESSSQTRSLTHTPQPGTGGQKYTTRRNRRAPPPRPAQKQQEKLQLCDSSSVSVVEECKPSLKKKPATRSVKRRATKHEETMDDDSLHTTGSEPSDHPSDDDTPFDLDEDSDHADTPVKADTKRGKGKPTAATTLRSTDREGSETPPPHPRNQSDVRKVRKEPQVDSDEQSSGRDATEDRKSDDWLSTRKRQEVFQAPSSQSKRRKTTSPRPSPGTIARTGALPRQTPKSKQESVIEIESIATSEDDDPPPAKPSPPPARLDNPKKKPSPRRRSRGNSTKKRLWETATKFNFSPP